MLRILGRTKLQNVFILLGTALFLSGCALFFEPTDKKEKAFLKSLSPTSKDYADQLSSLSRSYLNNKSIKEARLTKKSKRYLRGLIKVLASNNELIFPRAADFTPEFHVIKSKIPLVFSLPGYQFFFSDSLIIDYLKNESLLQAVITKEAIKSDQLIYPKNHIIPLGYIETPQVIALTRLKNISKVEINKWTFIAMKRSSWDPFAILNWIQTQNKNILDFSYQIENRRSIAREESAFRSFVASRDVKIVDEELENSSEEFYHLVKTLKRQRNGSSQRY